MEQVKVEWGVRLSHGDVQPCVNETQARLYALAPEGRRELVRREVTEWEGVE